MTEPDHVLTEQAARRTARTVREYLGDGRGGVPNRKTYPIPDDCDEGSAGCRDALCGPIESIAGFNADAIQVLSHDHGCLSWLDVTPCEPPAPPEPSSSSSSTPVPPVPPPTPGTCAIHDDFSIAIAGDRLHGHTPALIGTTIWLESLGMVKYDGGGNVLSSIAPDPEFDEHLGIIDSSPHGSGDTYPVEIELDCTGAAAQSTDGIGIVFRWVNADNYWLATARPNGGDWELAKIDGGVYNVIDSAAGVTLATATLRVQLDGDTITAIHPEAGTLSTVDAFNLSAPNHGYRGVMPGMGTPQFSLHEFKVCFT